MYILHGDLMPSILMEYFMSFKDWSRDQTAKHKEKTQENSKTAQLGDQSTPKAANPPTKTSPLGKP